MSVPAGPIPAQQLDDEPAGPPRRRRLDGPVARAVTVAVLALIGVEVGLFGAFFTLSTPELLGIAVPIGPIAGLAANLVVGFWTARLLGRYAVAAPTAGWLVAVLLLASARPEGDLVITSDVKGVAFLLLGALAWAVSAALGRPPHPTPGLGPAAGPQP